MSDFEQYFGDFIHRHEYDAAESALFSMVRISFIAGWLAAGGKPPKSQNVVELHKPRRVIPPEDSSHYIKTDIKLDTE